MCVPCPALTPPACLPRPSPLATQLTAEEHFENAEMAFAMENYDQAAKSFRRALDMEPEVRPLCWLQSFLFCLTALPDAAVTEHLLRPRHGARGAPFAGLAWRAGLLFADVLPWLLHDDCPT